MIFSRHNRPWYRKKRYYLLAVLIAFLIYAYQFLSLRLDDTELQARLGDNAWGYAAKVSYSPEKDGRQLRYVELGSDSLPLIAFIHGAPSSSSFWQSLMRDSTLLGHAKMLAIDRPGYGFSGFGRPDINVAHQASLIAGVLRRFRKAHQRIILHGSSYGGTVAARIAMDFPELIDGLLLQSASMAPGLEKIFWLTYPTSHWSLSWLIPTTLHVANTEKLSHRSQLEAMAGHWKQIEAPTILLHGSDDDLIYPENAYYACDKLECTPHLEMYMAPGRGHDLLWTMPALLRHSLLRLVAGQY